MVDVGVGDVIGIIECVLVIIDIDFDVFVLVYFIGEVVFVGWVFVVGFRDVIDFVFGLCVYLVIFIFVVCDFSFVGFVFLFWIGVVIIGFVIRWDIFLFYREIKEF